MDPLTLSSFTGRVEAELISGNSAGSVSLGPLTSGPTARPGSARSCSSSKRAEG